MGLRSDGWRHPLGHGVWLLVVSRLGGCACGKNFGPVRKVAVNRACR